MFAVEHGGAVRQGRRKLARPFDSRHPIHIVLRSSRARGNWSLLHRRNRDHIRRFTRAIAIRYEIKVERFSNLGNHVHLLVRARTRAQFQGFLRELGGTLACLVTGAKKGHAVGKFWDFLTYTRIIDFKAALKKIERCFVENLFATLLKCHRSRAARLLGAPITGWAHTILQPPD